MNKRQEERNEKEILERQEQSECLGCVLELHCLETKVSFYVIWPKAETLCYLYNLKQIARIIP